MIHLALPQPVPLSHVKRIIILTVVLLAGAMSGTGIARATPAWAQDPYPAPATPEINPIEDVPTAGDRTQPYPAPDAAVPSVVGQDSPPIPGQLPDPLIDVPAAPAQSPAGLYFLWGSFLAALLIFATAIVGAVVLFARRVE